MNQEGITAAMGFMTEFNKRLLGFLLARPGVPLESLKHSSDEIVIDLGRARTNEKIWDRSGDRIFILSCTGTAHIRFNRIESSLYKLRIGRMIQPFQTLYLTNTAQAGKELKFIIGYEAYVDFQAAYNVMKILDTADAEINPATTENITTLMQTLMNVTNPTDLRDLYDVLYLMIGSATPKSLKDLWDKLDAIVGKDFATQTTLDLIRTVMSACDANLSTIAGKDFATQTTLALIRAKTDNLDTSLAGIDFAEQTTLALIKTKTDEIANLINKATTPTKYTVTLTNADTEYSQALPAGTKKVCAHIRGGAVAYRIAWATGKVATPTDPYEEIDSDGIYQESGLDLTDKTLYFACGTAGKKMQIEAWV